MKLEYDFNGNFKFILPGDNMCLVGIKGDGPKIDVQVEGTNGAVQYVNSILENVASGLEELAQVFRRYKNDNSPQ